MISLLGMECKMYLIRVESRWKRRAHKLSNDTFTESTVKTLLLKYANDIFRKKLPRSTHAAYLSQICHSYQMAINLLYL